VQVPFGKNADTPKDAFVERSQLLPSSGDKVRMEEFCTDHRLYSRAFRIARVFAAFEEKPLRRALLSDDPSPSAPNRMLKRVERPILPADEGGSGHRM
jgi:hypothetical protein